MNSRLKLCHIITGCVAALCLAIFLGSAWADPVIYNGGSPDLSTIYFADANYGFTTDAVPFMLTAGSSTVTDAQWWGGCYPEGTCPSGNFTIGFYTDNAGAPDTLIASYAVGNANQTATGNFIGGVLLGVDEYVYTANFGPLALTPSTTYFFAVENNTGETDTWGMETTDETGGHEQYLTGVWTSQSADLAFNLSGTTAVPEPTSLLLLGTGLSALGLAAWRRRK